MDIIVLQQLTAFWALDLVPEPAAKVGSDGCGNADEARGWLVGAGLGDRRRGKLGHGLGVGANDAVTVPAEDIGQPPLVCDNNRGCLPCDLVSLPKPVRVSRVPKRNP